MTPAPTRFRRNAGRSSIKLPDNTGDDLEGLETPKTAYFAPSGREGTRTGEFYDVVLAGAPGSKAVAEAQRRADEAANNPDEVMTGVAAAAAARAADLFNRHAGRIHASKVGTRGERSDYSPGETAQALLRATEEDEDMPDFTEPDTTEPPKSDHDKAEAVALRHTATSRSWTGGGGFRYEILNNGDIRITNPKTGRTTNAARNSSLWDSVLKEAKDNDYWTKDWAARGGKAPRKEDAAPAPGTSDPDRLGGSESIPELDLVSERDEPAPKGGSGSWYDALFGETHRRLREDPYTGKTHGYLLDDLERVGPGVGRAVVDSLTENPIAQLFQGNYGGAALRAASPITQVSFLGGPSIADEIEGAVRGERPSGPGIGSAILESLTENPIAQLFQGNYGGAALRVASPITQASFLGGPSIADGIESLFASPNDNK